MWVVLLGRNWNLLIILKMPRPVIVLSYLLAAPSLPFVRDIKHDTARLSTWNLLKLIRQFN